MSDQPKHYTITYDAREGLFVLTFEGADVKVGLDAKQLSRWAFAHGADTVRWEGGALLKSEDM